MNVQQSMPTKLASLYFRPGVLNIFTDASGSNVTGDFCAGFIAFEVQPDSIERVPIYYGFQIMPTGTSNNFAEAYAIYMAVLYAGQPHVRQRFRYINIFSDSEINILGLRDRIYFYKQYYDQENMMLLKGPKSDPWANQDILLQIIYYIQEMQMPVSLFQIKGHINPDNPNDIVKARSVFQRNYNNQCIIDDSLIKDVSRLNNQVDQFTREQLNRSDMEKFRYILPISAVAMPNYNYDAYISLIRRNGVYCIKPRR